MKELLNELKKYIDIDKSINDFYLLLLNNENKVLTIIEIENLLNLLNSYLLIIKKLEQISTKRKNKILNILNEIILLYNELLMNEICKQL